jgi:hypothetical protein
MNLLIRGPVIKGKFGYQPEGYRGTDRERPYYRDDLAPNDSVNQAFLWYIDEGGESGLVHDLDRALKLAQAYRDGQPPQLFEVVEVTISDQQPEGGGSLIGYEVSAGYASSAVMPFLAEKSAANLSVVSSAEIVDPLLRLMQQHFRPLLNSHYLFDDYAVAAHFFDCVVATARISPRSWLNRWHEYEVVGLWRLPNA